MLSGWAGPRQDRFVPPTGEALDPASDDANSFTVEGSSV